MLNKVSEIGNTFLNNEQNLWVLQNSELTLHQINNTISVSAKLMEKNDFHSALLHLGPAYEAVDTLFYCDLDVHDCPSSRLITLYTSLCVMLCETYLNLHQPKQSRCFYEHTKNSLNKAYKQQTQYYDTNFTCLHCLDALQRARQEHVFYLAEQSWLTPKLKTLKFNDSVTV